MRKPRAIDSLRDHLKGRDRLAAIALERAGLVPRVVPYAFETCAGDSWSNSWNGRFVARA